MGKSEAAEKARNVRFVILDIHGVLTDNTLYYTQDGIKSELFSSTTGWGEGARRLRHRRLFSHEQDLPADEQMGKIYGIPPENLWGSSAKIGRLDEFEKDSGLKDDSICYVGDEMIDLGIMKRVFFSVAPADASEEARAVADYVTAAGGGKGVVRELAQFILEAQGKWGKFVEQFK